MGSKLWKFIAYDETNHGRFPEICVLTTSNNPLDILPQYNELNSEEILQKVIESFYHNTPHTKSPIGPEGTPRTRTDAHCPSCTERRAVCHLKVH